MANPNAGEKETGIPDGITRDDVVGAIEDLERGQIEHRFGPSMFYDVLYEGKRYPPKAVLGIAARRIRGRILEPNEFSGGEDSKCFAVLRDLGFQVAAKTDNAPSLSPRQLNHAIADGCRFFRENTPSRLWRDLPAETQEGYRRFREVMRRLLESVACNSIGRVPVHSHLSILNLSGRSPKHLWFCFFPEKVHNKSFALQVALIVSSRGVELCCCVGAGHAEIKDGDQQQECAMYLKMLKRKLAQLPQQLLKHYASAMPKTWKFREKFLQEPEEGEFDALATWAQFASSDIGNDASISRYLTPEEIEALQVPLDSEIREAISLFEPLFDFVYGDLSNLKLEVEPVEPPAARYWAISLGEEGRLWNECQEQGIIAIGWDLLGDLRTYPTREAIAEALRNSRGTDSPDPINASLACFQFANEMKIGDHVIAKIGRTRVLGLGTVQSEYEHAAGRATHRNVRRVQWLRAGRGVVVSGVLLGAVLSQQSASASVPALVVSNMIKVASLLAAGQAAGVVSVKVAALTEGVVKSMFMSKIKSVLTVVLVVGLTVGGIGAGVGLSTNRAAVAQTGPNPILSKLATGKLELEVKEAEKVPAKQDKEPVALPFDGNILTPVLTPKEAGRFNPTDAGASLKWLKQRAAEAWSAVDNGNDLAAKVLANRTKKEVLEHKEITWLVPLHRIGEDCLTLGGPMEIDSEKKLEYSIRLTRRPSKDMQTVSDDELRKLEKLPTPTAEWVLGLKKGDMVRVKGKVTDAVVRYDQKFPVATVWISLDNIEITPIKFVGEGK